MNEFCALGSVSSITEDFYMVKLESEEIPIVRSIASFDFVVDDAVR